jgi:hypothetical protein
MPNPFETADMSPSLVACGTSFPALDEGAVLGLPTPPGWSFYGFPQPSVDMDVNGYLDFAAGNGGTSTVAPFQACDFSGAAGDLGCAPPTAGTSRPRVDVNHADLDMVDLPAAPFVPELTMEMRPAGPNWADAIIYRWKNIPPLTFTAGSPGLNTNAFVAELHGSSCGSCAPALVPNRIVVVRSWIPNQDQVGIGPGPGIPAFAPYPAPPAAPTCGVAAGLGFMTTFGGFPPFVGAPAGVIHMDSTSTVPNVFSPAVLNSAIVFTPQLLAPPDGYTLTVY